MRRILATTLAAILCLTSALYAACTCKDCACGCNTTLRDAPKSTPAAGQPGTILYFHSKGCKYCRVFERYVQPRVDLNGFKLYDYDVDQPGNLFAHTSYGFTGCPAFVVFDRGGGYRIHEGFLPKEQFELFVKSGR